MTQPGNAWNSFWGCPRRARGWIIREQTLIWAFDEEASVTLSRHPDMFIVIVQYPPNMAVDGAFRRPANGEMSWSLLNVCRGEGLSVDTRHVAIAGPLRTAWIKQGWIEPRQDGTIQRIARVTFHCGQGWAGTLAFERIGRGGRSLEQRSHQVEELETAPIRPETALARSMRYICAMPATLLGPQARVPPA